jgi:hypothetical protein
MHVSCFSHTWFTYNLNTAFISTNIHNRGYMFVTPLTDSFLLPTPLLPFYILPLAYITCLNLPIYLLGNPLLCHGANACPLLPLVGGKLNSLPSTLPPPPPPQRPPLVHVTCPSKTTLQYQLCTVRYNYPQRSCMLICKRLVKEFNYLINYLDENNVF